MRRIVHAIGVGAALASACASSGCYHYTFQQREEPAQQTQARFIAQQPVERRRGFHIHQCR